MQLQLRKICFQGHLFGTLMTEFICMVFVCETVGGDTELRTEIFLLLFQATFILLLSEPLTSFFLSWSLSQKSVIQRFLFNTLIPRFLSNATNPEDYMRISRKSTEGIVRNDSSLQTPTIT